MKNKYKDMLLESGSGYMMPFALSDGEQLQTTLGFGEQKHPHTGERFNHHGVDLLTEGKPLYAIATGTVIGAGHDSVHENYIIAKYGKYEVKYGHIMEAYCPYGTSIQAGQEIGKSSQFLHVDVRFDGVYIDPMEFLAMIWANIQQLAAMGIHQMPTTENLGSKKVKTQYDKEQDEILMMMMRWLPSYMNELRSGSYLPPERVETKLRHIFSEAADRNFLFEKMPNMGNPLGLSERSIPLAEKIQNLLIEDFLSYAFLRHNAFPSSWGDTQKKKLSDQASQDGLVVDPLASLSIDVESYDVKHEAYVYFDSSGRRCWTKAWFNGREKGERAIEVSRQLAIKFINDEISHDDWLTRFYPKQMTVYHKAIEQARLQLLGL